MRNNNTIRQSLPIARLLVLALCLVLVFGIIMATRIDGVAFAAATDCNGCTTVEQDQDDSANLGKASPILGDTGNITGANFNYPGTANGTTSWTYTETYATLVPSTSNLNIAKVKGDTTMYMHTGQANHWYIGVSNAAKAAEVHGAINFNVGDFIAQMIQNDNVTVTATLTAYMSANSNVNNMFWAVIGVPSDETGLLTAKWSYDLRNSSKYEGLGDDPTDDEKDAYDARRDKFQIKNGDGDGFAKNSSKSDAVRTLGTVTLDSSTPNLALAFGCGWNQNAAIFSGKDHHIIMHDLTITYTITFNNATDAEDYTVYDNASPVVSTNFNLENAYTQGSSGTGYAPLHTDANTNDGFPVYYDSIKNKLAVDSVNDGAGQMKSYTGVSLGNVPGTSTPYYKYAQVEYVDLYNYSGVGIADAAVANLNSAKATIGAGDRILTGYNASTGSFTWSNTTDATHLKYASGIKNVTVNTSSINVYGINDGNDSAVQAIKAEDDSGNEQVVGYVQVRRINRTRVVVKIYMTGNATVTTTVTDYGKQSVSKTLVVSGIDTQAPVKADGISSGTVIDGNVLNTDSTKIDWIRENTLLVEPNVTISEDNEGVSPYLWFYTVNRADSLSALNGKRVESYSAYSNIKDAKDHDGNQLLPIAVGEFGTFEYSFKLGKAKGISSKDYNVGNPSTITDTVTGAGYYRFTFYLFDLAGNVGEVKQFYAKVDADTPNYTVDLSYINKKSEDVKLITQSSSRNSDGNIAINTSLNKNGSWATGKTTLTLTVVNGGFSGYTLVFEDSKYTHLIMVDGLGEYSGSSYGKIVRYSGTNNSISPTISTDNAGLTSITLPIVSNLNTADVNITYQIVNGNGVFTFVTDTQSNFAWVTQFTAYAGQYQSVNEIDKQDVTVSCGSSGLSGSINVLVDVTNPQNPSLNDAEDSEVAYVNSFTSYTLPGSSRSWYTGLYARFPAILEFADDILNSDYAGGLKVHYGIKTVTTLEQLTALMNLGIESNYINFDSTTNYSTYFDQKDEIIGTKLDEQSTEITVDLLAAKEAGMRVIYMWVEDQAGNKSALQRYFVLADNTSYTVKSNVKANSNLASASITQSNEDGVATTSFKRGQTISFAFAMQDGYVPFTLTQKTDGGNFVMLENYSATKAWTLTDSAYNGYIKINDAENVDYVLDNPTDLGKLDVVSTIEFAHRKVINYTVTNTSVAYTAQQTDIAGQISFSDIKAKDSFEYRFVDNNGKVLYVLESDAKSATSNVENAKKDTNGNPIYFVPVRVGSYNVNIFIPKDNDSYVTDDFTMDNDGNQTFTTIAYSIIKGTAVITALPTTSVYGDKIVLDYSVTGIEKDVDKMAEEGIVVNLALNIANFNPNTFYNIGSYAIVNTTSFNNVSNYTVTFESNYHTIEQRPVTINTWSATKVYGDSDPELKFAVGASQFASLDININTLLAQIFNTGYTSAGSEVVGSETYYLYKADDRIGREQKESVGEYDYTVSAGLFDIDSNFRIIIQNNNRFNITQRTVTLDASGQSSVLVYGTEITEDVIGAITPSYVIGAKDIALADEIDALVRGLSLNFSSKNPLTVEGYSAAYDFSVVLDADTSANIKLVLGDNAKYIVYVTEQNAIIVKLKDGVQFNEFVYGAFVWSEDTIKFDASKFDVTGDVPAFDNIVWTAKVSSSDAYLNAGRYLVTFENAKLVKDDVTLADAVFVESINITVNPAQIVVSPTHTATQKTYGEPETNFGIGYGIVSVNGNTSGTYANVAFAELLSKISGSFARALYTQNGTFSRLGSRYDDATDSLGAVLNGNGSYYGYAVNAKFAINDHNYSVSAQFDDAQRFVINRKEITIGTKDFVGISRVANGDTNVEYGTVKMYNLASLLALASDDVTLTASAQYDTIGSANVIATNAKISFTNISLTGDKAHNYKLAGIVNNGVETTVNGNGISGATYEITPDTIVVIKYVDNGEGTEYILIRGSSLGVYKTDIIIAKQYDKTTELNSSHISVSGRVSDGVGVAMLNGKTPLIIESESQMFPDSDVSSNYAINISLFYEFGEDTNSINIETQGTYKNSDISIVKTEINGKKGIKITIRNQKAVINQRVLDANSFVSVSAVDRDYNATTIVDMKFELKDGAIVAGDTVEDLGLRLRGIADSKNAGVRLVSFAPVSKTNTGENTYLSNGNYTVDIDALNSRYTGANKLSVNINRARLMPNVTFEDRDYDATTDVDVEQDGTFTTVQYAANLQDELAHFSYDKSAVSYKLSSLGKEDPNVTESGLHNVLVSGLEVVVSNIDAASREQFLANYQLYGSRYSEQEKQYNTVGSITTGIVDDYEILDAVKINKKHIQIMEQYFVIADKVYDGTTDANISLDLPEESMLPGHIELFDVRADGTFARRQVGNNIKIKIGTIELVPKTAEAGIILNNYQLDRFTSTITGNIVPRPIVVTANLGEKEYNGNEKVPKSNITYSYNGILASDTEYYSVKADSAFFSDKNVSLVKNADGTITILEKNGIVYSPELTNIKERYINYIMVYPSNSKIDGKQCKAYDVNNERFYGDVPAGVEADTYYYELDTVSKYISANDADKLANAVDSIIGFYTIGNDDVYFVANDYSGDVTGTIAEPLTYLGGSGKITQRKVYFNRNGIEKLADEAFAKQYDGTSKFYGVLGTDYQFKTTGIAGVIGDDNVTIQNVYAEFDKADCDALYVVFSVSGIAGEDADNYTIDDQRGTISISAKITARQIDASLADNEMVYGTSLSNVGGSVTYTMGGKALVWDEENSAFFIGFKEYLVMTGFIDSVDEETDEADDKYVAMLNAMTYNLVDGQFVKATDGEVGEYIIVGRVGSDKVTLPKTRAIFDGTIRPNAGEESVSYTLYGGSAKNYAFNYRYTNGVTSKVTVVKKDLYIVTTQNAYSKLYGESDPTIELRYLDANGGKGIVGGETWTTLFKNGSVDYRPVVKLGIYNANTHTTIDAGEYAKISRRLNGDNHNAVLGENEYYVFYLAAPDGVNYESIIANYNVILGDLNSVSGAYVLDGANNLLDEYGKKVIELTFAFDGVDAGFGASTLEITLPEIANVEVSAVGNTFAYDKDADRVKEVVVKGAVDGDDIRFVTTDENDNEVKLDVVNAGEYEGYIVLKREYKLDDNDPNNYYAEWQDGYVIKIVIEKASANLQAKSVNEYYNGKAQEYPMSGASNKFSYNSALTFGKNDIELVYEMFNGTDYEKVDKMVDAGTYRVTIKLTDAFAKANPNYKQESVTTTYTISRAIVNVTIDASGYDISDEMLEGAKILKLSGVYDENNSYDIDYTIAMYEKSNDAAIALSKEQTALTFSSEVNSAGRYYFSVALADDSLKASNYNFVTAKGVLELKAKKLSSSNAQIDINGDGIVANTLVVTEIKTDSVIADDKAYLDIIERYVASLSTQAEFEEAAKVAAVLRVSVYCDDNLVSLDGTSTTIGVKLPEAVGDMSGIAVYCVNRNGGMDKLTDYEIKDGMLVYSTDYVSAIVFVDLNPTPIEAWKIYTVVAVVAFILLVIIASVVCVVIKKSKLKKLA